MIIFIEVLHLVTFVNIIAGFGEGQYSTDLINSNSKVSDPWPKSPLLTNILAVFQLLVVIYKSNGKQL